MAKSKYNYFGSVTIHNLETSYNRQGKTIAIINYELESKIKDVLVYVEGLNTKPSNKNNLNATIEEAIDSGTGPGTIECKGFCACSVRHGNSDWVYCACGSGTLSGDKCSMHITKPTN